MDEQRRERDLVLAPNEYAYILDETKGHVNILGGPNKTSLSATDKPVILDYTTKRFVPCSLDKSIQLKVAAPEGWYIILKNPSTDPKKEFPAEGSNSSVPDMDIGRKINIAGPRSFALWPGQMAKVVRGHRLKNNEYVLIRVYDEDAARRNWHLQAVAVQSDEEKSASDDDTGDTEFPTLSSSKKNVAADLIKPEDLKMGKLLIIKGTDVSFFIPPTGVEVYPDTRGDFVREAVTLEQIEYCQLTDQNGTKRYERGPKVVFPKPTERFVTVQEDGNDKPSRKFRAIELNPNSGIYIKIIADYEDGGRKFIAGEELFITGKDQPIYFPREEHAIIKYGDDGEEQEIHYGIAIPKGEARYVMDRDSGEISLARGPQVLLPDPRKQVIIKRILDPQVCQLMYPGNIEALEYNTALLRESGFESFNDAEGAGAVGAAMALAESNLDVANNRLMRGYDNSHRRFARMAAKSFGGDSFKRKSEYTKPRTITLNTKYDGAVTVSPHTGYAIMVVDKSGNRKVVVGPRTVLLEYDEILQVLEFSTGKPKSDKNPIKQVYLRVMNNKVSDIINARTKDFCEVEIPVSFGVNFDPDYQDKWFDVENYVKLLCEHMRSKIRNAVMRLSIEEFYKNSTDIIRDVVLGPKGESITFNSDTDEEVVSTTPRPGFLFKENGMRIDEVEVLDTKLQNQEIQSLLTNSERDVIKNNLNIAAEERRLAFVQKTETISQDVARAQAETRKVHSILEDQDIANSTKLALARIEAKTKQELRGHEGKRSVQEILDAITASELARSAKSEQQGIDFSEKRLEVQIKDLQSQVDAAVKQGSIFTTDLIAALTRFGDDEIVTRATEALGPLGMLKLVGGDSIADVLKNIFKGSALEDALPPALGGTNNGKPRPRPSAS